MMRNITGYKAHWASGNGDAVLSKNSTIYYYNYDENNFTKIYRFKYQKPFLGIINRGPIERFLRGGIHHVIKINDNYVIFFDRRIFTLHGGKINSVFEIETCKRPLNVCYNAEEGSIYWGDYVAGRERLPINIYRSTNFGKDWEIVYTFSPGIVRHIHNIIYDKFRKHYWILTGDTDAESGIWETSDFINIKPVLSGNQKYRATSLIPLKEGLIIPTDTEVMRNYIQYYSYLDKTITNIKEIPGSSIAADRINEFSFVGTMVEPSSVNKSPNSNLYVSQNNKDWFELLSLKRDILPVKYFQYPAISIPKYEDNYSADRYYFNIRNMKQYSGVLIFKKDEILEIIK